MKRILKSISYMAVMATAVATFSSCEDELPDPIVKPRTAVTIQTDWGACGLNNVPNSYFLSVNDEVSTVSGNTQQLTLKSNNDYTFRCYNGASHITVAEARATVDASTFMVSDANAINGNPDAFCYGVATETDLTGDSQNYTIAMKRLTRKLTLTTPDLAAKNAEGKDLSVQGGYAILTGAYSSYNMVSGVANTPVSAVSEVTVNAEDKSIVAPFNLFGLDLDGDITLSYVLSMSDGTTLKGSADVKDALANFNDGSIEDVNINVENAEFEDPTFNFPYNSIYAWGSATSAGWDWNDKAVELTKINKYTYSAEMELKAGELKFMLGGSNWDGVQAWLMAATPGASLSETAAEVVSRADGDAHDYKWSVSAAEAGKYQIVINLKKMTMTATKID